MRTILPLDKNPALREKAREIPVADIGSKKIRALIADMKALLAKEEYGVALAACQVGEPLKLFIVSGKAMARGMRLPAPSEARQAGNSPDPSHQGEAEADEPGMQPPETEDDAPPPPPAETGAARETKSRDASRPSTSSCGSTSLPRSAAVSCAEMSGCRSTSR